jgi:RHS repeat-associated protein
VGYTHAGGIDRPLVVWKGIGATPTEVVVPHANWRGVYGKGTTSSGATSTVPIEWPGFKTTAYHSMGPSQQSTTNWMGSLIGGQRDPGGTMYMRNRYYDPQTGQFTQTDPIGIGGGLNTYGFAAGDPVGNWDPFGTCAWGIGPDAAFGRCSGMEPQDRHACTRDATGWCETYTATPEQWSRIEREILRISRRTAYCAGARSLLLSLWNRGRTARGIRFWDGYFGIYEGEIMVGQYMGYTGFDHVEYDPREAFRDPQVVPHEGLHLYYRRNPPPGMDYVKDYQAIHRIIHQQDGECAR